MPNQSWNDMSEEEVKAAYSAPHPEAEITQEMRQEKYDNYPRRTIWNGHSRCCERSRGQPVLHCKELWGQKRFKPGYLYASDSYVRLKTISIMMHKDSLPKA